MAPAAQELVADLDPAQHSTFSEPRSFVEMGGLVYFTAESPEYGRELFVSDGTPGGTQLVSDIRPGPTGGLLFTSRLETNGSVLYFEAQTRDQGREVWRSDGTAAGTEFVVDVRRGTDESSAPRQFVFSDDLVYFRARTEDFAADDLWRTDGTASGTVLLADLTASTWPDDLTPFLGGLLFVERHANRLFFSDGTPDGTVPLAQFIGIGQIAVHGGIALFRATSLSGSSLWSFDGESVAEMPDVQTGLAPLSPHDFTVFEGDLHFVADQQPGERRLYRLLPDESGVEVVSDDPLWMHYFAGESEIVSAGPNLFVTIEPEHWIQHFYRYDGDQFFLVGTHYTGPNNPATKFQALGSSMLFSATTVPGGCGLWLAGQDSTELVHSLGSGIISCYVDLTVIGSQAWFNRYDTWVLDLSAPKDPTIEVLLVHPGPVGYSSSPENLARLGGDLYFAADTPEHGSELWKKTGATANELIAAEINPGSGSSKPHALVPFGDRLLFNATIFTVGTFLRLTDGTQQGTVTVNDPMPIPFPPVVTPLSKGAYFAGDRPETGSEPYVIDSSYGDAVLLGNLKFGSFDSSPHGFTEIGDHVFFDAAGESWVTDGTPAGTISASELDLGQLVDPGGFAAFGDRVVFSASNPATGAELWIADTEFESTNSLGDLLPGPDGSAPSDMLEAGGLLFFTADGPGPSRSLFATDGSPAGTRLLLDAEPDSEFLGFTALEDRLLFSCSGEGQRELWSSDGSVVGTVPLLVDVSSVTLELSVESPLIAGRNAYFNARLAGEVHFGLWATDGTQAGTIRVIDESRRLTEYIAPGAGEAIVFTHEDPVTGPEVWVSDGSAAGTHVLFDGVPDTRGLEPAGYARIGNRVYFSGYEASSGRELYSLPLASTGNFAAETFGLGCPGTAGVVPAIGWSGDARLGSALDVEIERAQPHATALLFYSFEFRRTVLGAGCTAYVSTQPLLYFGGTTTDSSGFAALTASVPNLSFLLGLETYFQYAVADPDGAFGGAWALTQGLETVVGPAAAN